MTPETNQPEFNEWFRRAAEAEAEVPILVPWKKLPPEEEERLRATMPRPGEQNQASGEPKPLPQAS